MVVGGSSNAQGAQQLAVISRQYCVNYPVDLTIVRKQMDGGNFEVTDVNGNIMFRVKGTLFSLRDRRFLYDVSGNPVISFHQKLLSANKRRMVFRGDSTDPKNLLFSVKKSSFLHMKTKLHVFLASNLSEASCDFSIEGSSFDRSCVIYAGNSSKIIAQMHRKHSSQSILLGKDTLGVTVYPEVDYAFIVALVLILEAINED